MSKKHVSSIVKASRFLASFNHQLFAALETAGISDEQLSETKPPPILAEMIAACGFDGFINPDITKEHFPVNPKLFTTRGSKVYHFNRAMTTAKVKAAMRKEGCRPAPI